jgi:hypothetical protein
MSRDAPYDRDFRDALHSKDVSPGDEEPMIMCLSRLLSTLAQGYEEHCIVLLSIWRKQADYIIIVEGEPARTRCNA